MSANAKKFYCKLIALTHAFDVNREFVEILDLMLKAGRLSTTLTCRDLSDEPKLRAEIFRLLKACLNQAAAKSPIYGQDVWDCAKYMHSLVASRVAV